MAYRFRQRKGGIVPGVPEYDGHFVHVEWEGFDEPGDDPERWHWFIVHPPTCRMVSETESGFGMVTYPDCWAENMVANAGGWAFGETDGDWPMQPGWPKCLPHLDGWRTPLGFMLVVYSDYYNGDEVDTFLVVPGEVT